MKKITEFDLKGRRVLIRCDLNLPLDEKGGVRDDFRVRESVPTIEYAIEKGAKVVLASHLGRPGGEKKKKFSLSPVQDKLVEHLDLSVVKADDCIGQKIEKWTKEMEEGEVLLLENLRFHDGEKDNDRRFSKRLARLADLYINDAFGVGHRAHASVVGVPRLLPSGIGLLFERELKALSRIRDGSEPPLIGIVGGAKLEAKIKPLPNFLKMADHLLVGGRVGEVLRRCRDGEGVEQGLREITGRIDLQNPKLVLPLDGVYRKGRVFDIGEGTIREFKKIIKKGGSVFWAGPLGNTDLEEFEKGSREVAEAVQRSASFSVAGGGDTVAFLRRNDLSKGFDHVSTGGSSMLEFLSTGTLPALEALEV